jgi:uncharacterized membrane protein YeaQ/YmgE (transglycosylase-associated protein family)
MGDVGLLSWIVVGFLAGAVAGRVAHQRLGCLTKIVVGIVGALIGGALARAAGLGGIGHFGLRALLLAAVGASALELVLRAVEQRGSWPR